MQSVLSEIIKLRNGIIPTIDYHNSNRYRVVVSEKNVSKTAYCFSVPVYNNNSRRLINLNFHKTEGGLVFHGSDAEITMGQDIVLKNKNGFCRISNSMYSASGTEKNIRHSDTEIFPTLNGICFKALCTRHQSYDINLLLDRAFMNVRAIDRVFSLMSDEFRPFVTISCIGVQDAEGRFIAPCELDYQKVSDTEYIIHIGHNESCGKVLMFEINLYEEKLFHDTTVESKHPNLNNAYGTTAFIGHTPFYGEQWLYSRPDFSRLPELYDKQIIKAVLHIPRYAGQCGLTAYSLATRFCSFGSTWENKIPSVQELAKIYSVNGYQSLNITKLIADESGYLNPFEGFILKPNERKSDFSMLSTGDSFFAPQILEVSFR